MVRFFVFCSFFLHKWKNKNKNEEKKTTTTTSRGLNWREKKYILKNLREKKMCLLATGYNNQKLLTHKNAHTKSLIQWIQYISMNFFFLSSQNALPFKINGDQKEFSQENAEHKRQYLNG